jgi:hypothetical protein
VIEGSIADKANPVLPSKMLYWRANLQDCEVNVFSWCRWYFDSGGLVGFAE